MNQPTRALLASNLNRLMGEQRRLGTNQKLSSITGLGIGTLSRLRNAKVGATLDTLDILAQAFNLPPCQLITNGETE